MSANQADTKSRFPIDAMDPADLIACAGEVAGFLLPKALLASLDA